MCSARYRPWPLRRNWSSARVTTSRASHGAQHVAHVDAQNPTDHRGRGARAGGEALVSPEPLAQLRVGGAAGPMTSRVSPVPHPSESHSKTESATDGGIPIG